MTKLNSNNSSGSIVDGASTNEELSNGATTIGDNNASISNGLNGGLRKGPWTSAEDEILTDHVRRMGEGNWNAVQRSTGLLRCGKSCRLRWANHLRPNLKKGPFSSDEEIIILRLHARLGNKWARISTHLEGRTDNEIKNYWNTRLKRRQRAGLPIYPPEIEREFRKYNQNIAPYPDNQNPNLNTQSLLMHPSPLNFPTQHSNGMGQNPLMNQNYQQFPNQMQNEMPMRQYGPKLGHNQGQFRQQQMSYGLTNFGTNSSNMMPNSFPTVKTEISPNQLYSDQTSVPRPVTNNINGTMFDAQQGGNFQNMHKIQVLPSMPQLVRGDSNSNWVNGNCVNMGGSNGNMNRQGDGNGLHGKWAGPDCMNGGANNMGIKSEFNEADIIGTMDELSNLINDATNTNVAQWLNGDVPSSNGVETSIVGGGGGPMIMDDGIAMGINQHFVPPLAH